jgi:hypothetical protein
MEERERCEGRDVVERSRENGRRGHVKVDSKALHRKTREQGSPKMIHTGQLDIDVTMDEAEKSEVEPIEQFSETHRSPVNVRMYRTPSRRSDRGEKD